MDMLKAIAEPLLESLAVSPEPKIFCLSLPKTATTSLHVYLEDAGLRVAGSGAMKPAWEEQTPERLARVAEQCIVRLEGCDAFQEHPWCFLGEVYREKFPSARYVVFQRPFEGWLKSYQFHLQDRPQLRVFEALLGVSNGTTDEAVFRTAYDAHYANIVKVTEGRPTLTLRIDQDDATTICEKLNAFLGLSVAEFPHRIKHQKHLSAQVKRALEAGEDANAILDKYRSIYGEDKALKRAARLTAADSAGAAE